MEVVTLAHRTQGLILAGGNPKGIKRIGDVARPEVRFVNRNAGSGTRLWFDTELKRLRIPFEHVNGYDREVKTHTEAADLIVSNKADAALGLQAAAQQHGLDFHPAVRGTLRSCPAARGGKAIESAARFHPNGGFPRDAQTAWRLQPLPQRGTGWHMKHLFYF
jgi:hypothetical protein